ncbi:Anaerobic nitric oxide reductase transcription regulator NorR [Fusobacterium sp. DD29]|nr:MULTISPECIES: sigma 54-interacting transcriptional regulator [unclassified Fusobacterium]MBR8760776.1 Anaerobic nitric oxide reductase transcription regulator NorR [Fusobacterium sp. DD25]MBR8799481.1 Anaerobic nitric oxide reductase transcription regulator NorR [Fusobacterium sp. DD10]MBR8819731.1 Anaerobic nitric oxide reductase transcription regulator NorR [Fusobacterium sp. DD3]MBR8700957.1 Anaerobic nitric oxide reductase transcription regulator NorR [Fusobacterium sp. DD45]MBR8748509.
MDILFKLKKDIMLYAETIANILNVDVEVMDQNLIRIAGTGRLADKVGLNMSKESHVYKHVLKTGKTIIIANPRKEPLCKNCPSIGECKEYLELSTPIIFDSSPIGVIGLICFNDEQKEEFIQKKESYIKFIEQMASFVSSHLYQETEKIRIENNNKVLLNIVDRIPNPIIITNEYNQIELINEMGSALFQSPEVHSDVKVTNLEQFIDKKKFILTCNNVKNEVVGDILDFPTHMGRFRTLYIFEEAVKFRSYLRQFNTDEEHSFIFSSAEMQEVYVKALKVAKTTTSVLITGESGTGKEVIAKIIHCNSERKNKPFIPINCGAIPENLIESELFGYVKGAFTGANPKGKVGYFEQANGGTIFLDEIGDMPLPLQVKLLRVLQEKTISPVGSDTSKTIDVRVIAATNQNLLEMVKENTFRGDLFYRLNVFPINIPPLRVRPVDIKAISEFFVTKYCRKFGTSQKKLSPQVMNSFISYPWPGNIRELKNIIEYLVNVVDVNENVITTVHLPPHFTTTGNSELFKTMAQIEKETIEKMLSKFGYTSAAKQKIAKILDIGIATLYRKIKQYQLEKE